MEYCDYESVDVCDLIYAAAAIDCEGCIGIYTPRQSNGNSNYFHIRVNVANTDSVLTNWMLETFGGSIASTHKGDKHKKTVYYWYVGAQQACDFLRCVLPYLKLKWEQAEIVLKLGKRMNTENNQPLSEEELEVRRTLREAIGILNKKGV